MLVTLGRTSTRRLSTCCPPVQEIVRAAVKDPNCPCDFGVVCGSRGEGGQTAAFESGKSNAKWGSSDHNVMRGDAPYSMAVDLAPYSSKLRNYIWDDEELFAALASHLMSTASRLGYKLEWGGNYTSIKDMPHYSLLFK
ncbi:M15 family metallopeptidase [Candidatus Pacearchaeota archaeon]|nr:M15 family metallopeptidase [Candidatus Pacearchaeota archaeon]